MRVIAVDDEPRALNLITIMLEKIPDVEVADCFDNALEALQFIRGQAVDAVFADIEMPGMTGLEFARQVALLPNPPAVVFVTGYKEYAADAWDLQAAAYVTKPYTQEKIAAALQRAARLKAPRKNASGLQINCFPDLGIVYDGVPVYIKNKKCRELLAYLVHNRGQWVALENIMAALFEDSALESRSYYNSLIFRLRKSLRDAGIEDLIETRPGQCRVNADRFTCDYYRFLEGEKRLFMGSYLSSYSWAEPTTAYLTNMR